MALIEQVCGPGPVIDHLVEFGRGTGDNLGLYETDLLDLLTQPNMFTENGVLILGRATILGSSETGLYLKGEVEEDHHNPNGVWHVYQEGKTNW
jgi:hypothetical protein